MQRVTEGNFRIGIVRPYHVEDHENGDKGIGNVGEFEEAARDENDRHKEKDEVVLKEPIVPIHRVNSRPDPDGEEDKAEGDAIVCHC